MFFACLPCIFGFNIWSDFNILGKGVLDLEDFVVSNLLLPIGAMVYNDPAVYQSRTNDTCGRNAGHVGIYIGNGQIISNIGGTTIDTVEGWTAYYGFGGWGWGGAVVPQK